MKRPAFFSIEEIPEGKTIHDINPAFAGIKQEWRVGKMSLRCASCRKPFNKVRKPRKEIKLYPAELPIPIGWAYRLCGSCVALHQRGGQFRDSVLAAIESFHLGEIPTQ